MDVNLQMAISDGSKTLETRMAEVGMDVIPQTKKVTHATVRRATLMDVPEEIVVFMMGDLIDRGFGLDVLSLMSTCRYLYMCGKCSHRVMRCVRAYGEALSIKSVENARQRWGVGNWDIFEDLETTQICLNECPVQTFIPRLNVLDCSAGRDAGTLLVLASRHGWIPVKVVLSERGDLLEETVLEMPWGMAEGRRGQRVARGALCVDGGVVLCVGHPKSAMRSANHLVVYNRGHFVPSAVYRMFSCMRGDLDGFRVLGGVATVCVDDGGPPQHLCLASRRIFRRPFKTKGGVDAKAYIW